MRRREHLVVAVCSLTLLAVTSAMGALGAVPGLLGPAAEATRSPSDNAGDSADAAPLRRAAGPFALAGSGIGLMLIRRVTAR